MKKTKKNQIKKKIHKNKQRKKENRNLAIQQLHFTNIIKKLDMSLFSPQEQNILKHVKNNFQYTLYVPSIPKHGINQISCDLYLLGNHYEFTKHNTRLDTATA